MNSNESMNSGEYKISLQSFLTVIRRCWYWVALAALLAGLLSGVYTRFFVTKTYSSTVMLYVNPNPKAYPSGSNYNFNTAQELAKVYPTVLKNSDEFSKAVAQYMGEAQNSQGQPLAGWTGVEAWRQVRGKMTAGTINDQEIVYIRMTSPDPEEAYALAIAAATKAEGILNSIVGTGNIILLSEPVLPTSPNSPGVARNVVLYGALAGLLVYVIFFLLELFDTTVYDEEDLQKFGMPILGMVPFFPDEDEMQASGKRPERSKVQGR